MAIGSFYSREKIERISSGRESGDGEWRPWGFTFGSFFEEGRGGGGVTIGSFILKKEKRICCGRGKGRGPGSKTEAQGIEEKRRNFQKAVGFLGRAGTGKKHGEIYM